VTTARGTEPEWKLGPMIDAKPPPLDKEAACHTNTGHQSKRPRRGGIFTICAHSEVKEPLIIEHPDESDEAYGARLDRIFEDVDGRVRAAGVSLDAGYRHWPADARAELENSCEFMLHPTNYGRDETWRRQYIHCMPTMSYRPSELKAEHRLVNTFPPGFLLNRVPDVPPQPCARRRENHGHVPSGLPYPGNAAGEPSPEGHFTGDRDLDGLLD